VIGACTKTSAAAVKQEMAGRIWRWIILTLLPDPLTSNTSPQHGGNEIWGSSPEILKRDQSTQTSANWGRIVQSRFKILYNLAPWDKASLLVA
jgi:hypothetical protein